MEVLNTIFGSFVTALEGGTTALAVYAIPILGACACIWFYWQTGLDFALGHGDLSTPLGGLLIRVLVIGIYMWVLIYWVPMTNAILDTMIFFASLGFTTGGVDFLRTPATLWEAGLAAAKPIADFDTWQRSLAAAWNFTVKPLDLASFVIIIASFLVLALHVGMLLVEFFLSVLLGVVLLPWALLRGVGHLGELAVGWLTGTAIRALVSCTLVGIARPLFATLGAVPGIPPPSGILDRLGALVIPQAPSYLASFSLVGASLVFLTLCLIIPNRAARLAGIGLALSGNDLAGAAAGAARFGIGASGVLRGTSRMLARV